MTWPPGGGGTAALAIGLNTLTGASAIHTTFRSPSDPNFYDENDYKKALAQLLLAVKPIVVLDIHGSDDRRPYDVDLGTMNDVSLLGRKELVERLIVILRSHGIEAISSNFLAASKSQTVTKFVSNHSVPAIQMEINTVWLNPAGGDLAEHHFSQLLDALADYVRVIAAVAVQQSH